MKSNLDMEIDVDEDDMKAKPVLAFEISAASVESESLSVAIIHSFVCLPWLALLACCASHLCLFVRAQ